MPYSSAKTCGCGKIERNSRGENFNLDQIHLLHFNTVVREAAVKYDTSNSYNMQYKVPLGDVVDLKSRGCRELKRGNTGRRSFVYERCEVHLCCTAAVLRELF